MYELLGTRFRVQAEDASLIEGLDQLLAPFRSDDMPTRARNTYGFVDSGHIEGRDDGKLLVYRNCSMIGSAEPDDPGSAVGVLLTWLNRLAVQEYEQFAAHAGLIVSGGTTIALPAESGHGKTTLTAACLESGFDYGSDEAICVDVSSGEVIPYPKPLGLSSWSRHALGIDDSALAFPAGAAEGFVTAEQLGAKIANGPLELDHVVIAEYGHHATELIEAPGSEAMRMLLEMSFNHYKFGADAFHLAARLANAARTWRLTYDNPLEAAELLMDRLG